MEKETFNIFKDLLSKFETAPHNELKEDYGIDLTIRQHIDSINRYLYDAQNILRQRFDYKTEELDNLFNDNKEALNMAIMLHDVNQLEGMDEDFYSDDKEKKERKIKDVLKKYLKDEFEGLNPLVLKIIFNKDTELKDSKKIEDFVSANEPSFIWMLSIFLIAHNYGVASTIPEFSDTNGNNKSPNFMLIDMFTKKKFSIYLDSIENIMGKAEKEVNGDSFMGKVILVNKVMNNEIEKPKIEEETGMADIGGGGAATTAQWGTSGNNVSALSSNLFGKPVRRVYPKSLGIKKKSKKMRSPIGIINSTNFNINL